VTGPPHAPRRSGSGRSIGWAAVVAAVIASVAVWTMNRSHRLPGTHSDGVEYVTAAEAMAARGRPEIPVTHWSDPDSTTVLSHYPPGFPALLAIPLALGASPPTAVTAVLAVGAGLAVAMTVLLAAGIGGLHAGVVAGALVMATPAFAILHLAVWSEAAYLGIALLGLWTIIRHPDRPGVHGALMAVGLGIRYVGIAGVATAVVFAWVRGRALVDRIRAALWAGAPGLVGLVAWRWWVRSGGEVIRSPDVYAGAGTQLRDVVLLLVQWLAPIHLTRLVSPAVVLFVVFMGAVAVMVGAWPRETDIPAGTEGRAAAAGDGSTAAGQGRGTTTPEGSLHGRWTLPPGRARRVFLVFAVAYAGVVLLSRAFLDPLIPFDPRLFLPLLLLATVTFGVTLAGRSRRIGAPWAVALHGLVAIWAVAGLLDIRETVQVSAEEGRFYTHRAWESDPAAVAAYTSRAPHVYSNEAAMVVHYGRRPAKTLPRSYEDLNAFARAWRDRPGPILFKLPRNPVDPPMDRFLELLPVREARRTEHAVLLLPVPGG